MSLKRTNPADPVSFLIDEDSMSTSGGRIVIDLRSLLSPETIVIRDLDDLEGLRTDGDAIFLTAGKNYFVLGDLDLGTSRLIVTGPVSIVGAGAETTTLRTSNANPMIECRGETANLNVEEITLRNNGGPLIEFNEIDPEDSYERTLSCLKVNFTGSGDVLHFQDAAFVLLNECAWLMCSGVGLRIDRTILGAVVNNSAARMNEDDFIVIQAPSTSTVATRIRLTLSSISSPTGGYALDVDPASIEDERLVVMGVNFNGVGDVIAPGSVGPDSPKAYFKTNLGVESTYPRAAYTLTTPAAVSASGTPIKLGGTTTGVESQLFDFPADNRARYIGSKPRRFYASASVTVETAANNQNLRLNFAIDGVLVPSYAVEANTSGGGGNRREAIPLSAVLNLDPNSYVELWVTNLSGTTDTTWDAGQVILTEIGG